MTDPSAALFFSTSITTRPPAPGRFSTIVEDAYAFICSAKSLAMTSLGPPAGKPTMMRAVACNGCDQSWRETQCVRRDTARTPKQETPAIGPGHATNVSHCNPLLC